MPDLLDTSGAICTSCMLTPNAQLINKMSVSAQSVRNGLGHDKFYSGFR